MQQYIVLIKLLCVDICSELWLSAERTAGVVMRPQVFWVSTPGNSKNIVPTKKLKE
jgi:hypothetical protein